jgi:hypothetical protein
MSYKHHRPKGRIVINAICSNKARGVVLIRIDNFYYKQDIEFDTLGWTLDEIRDNPSLFIERHINECHIRQYYDYEGRGWLNYDFQKYVKDKIKKYGVKCAF